MPWLMWVRVKNVSAFSATAMWFLPTGHGGAHQRDEAIDIESFFLGVRILAHYVLACDAHLNP